MNAFAAGFDAGFSRAVELERSDIDGRMSPPEYFWSYEFRFDLRGATRGEQEAVRTCLLAQKLDLDGFTWKHAAIVKLVLGHELEAERIVARGYVAYDEVAAASREP